MMKVYSKVVINMATNEVEKEEFIHYTGPVELLKGGGGASGSIDFPTYLKEVHADLLADGEPDGTGLTLINTSLVAVMNVALGAGGNPYVDATRPSGAKAYDPSTLLTAMQTEFSEFDTAVDALADTTTWNSFIDNVKTKLAESGMFPTPTFLDALSTALTGLTTAATSVLSSTPISDFISSVEAEELSSFQRSIGRFASGMADINAIQTSSFIIGLALREQDYENKIERLRRETHLETFRTIVLEGIRAHLEASLKQQGVRDQMLSVGVEQTLRLLDHKTRNLKDSAALLAEINRISIVANQEQTNTNLDLDVKEATWDLEVFSYASNLMAGISGGTGSTGKAPLSTAQSVLGGALGGASVGSAFGPPGAIVGAIGGGIIGAFG